MLREGETRVVPRFACIKFKNHKKEKLRMSTVCREGQTLMLKPKPVVQAFLQHCAVQSFYSWSTCTDVSAAYISPIHTSPRYKLRLNSMFICSLNDIVV
jgi:hypothetical protein